MTTIAYNQKDREIAVDSRTTRGGLISTDSATKVKKIEGVLFFISGSSCDDKEIIDCYFAGKQGVKSEVNNGNVALVVDAGMVYRVAFDSDDGFFIQEVTHSDAVGSGSNFAIAAMDFGKSAKEAVEYAITRDAYTGGQVHVFKIDEIPE